MIDSQMDDMIKEKLSLKEKVDSLEQNLSKQITKKECLLETFNVFKNKSKEKENKYIEAEIHLEQKIKELNNIVFKVGQSAQTVHMLTKPQSFYDNVHKRALGYQNPSYLKKAQRMKTNLYDGIVVSEKHVAMTVIDKEETLLLEEESRSKILAKDFEKRFTPQQELLAEQAFWLHISNPTNESSLPPVRVEVPIELPKRSESLNLDAEFSKSKQEYNDLLNKYSQLEKHCISLENDLKAQLKDKDTTICKLKDNIKSLRKNNKDEIVVHDKCDLATINVELENSVAKLLFENERLCKEINHVKQVFKDQFDTIKQTCVLQKEQCLVEQAKAKQPFDNELDFACKHAKRIQELLVYVRDTCPSEIRLSEIKVAIPPMNKIKKVTFAEPIVTSSTNQETHDSNKPMLHSTRVKCSTSASGSKPSDNIKNNRISQPLSSNKINKVEDQPRSIKTRKNNKNCVKKVKCDDHVMQSSSDVNSVSIPINNAPVKNSINDVKSGCLYAICAKKHKKQNVCKPTGHVFIEVGLKWKPTGRTFTIFGNSCPLTRFTSTNVVHPKQPTSHSDEIEKPEIKVYYRKPKQVKHIGLSKLAKIVESKNANHSEPNHTWGSIATAIPSSSSFIMIGCPDVLGYLDSGYSKHMIGNRSQLMNFISEFLGTVSFENNQITRIMRCGDYQLGNVFISRVYYVEGLGHNLFSVGQFCDADLKVAFCKNTCFIRDLEGFDLISGSRDINLYTISFDDMLKSSLICLLSKASKTKSWVWYRRLSHLNFSTLNKLAKDDLARGILRLKF
nr:integrase, catalytic region, zinc finger, CCHC-type, peptidase aspartic, catalytic [Tanacetum cinerariifolium]